METAKRKICFVLTSNIHYGRSKRLLEEIRSHDGLHLQTIVAASALLSNYGDILSTLEADGFHCDAKIMMTVEGGNPVAMAKTAGLGILEFTTAFANLTPDVVVVRGDRYEVLSAVVAAAYLNIPIAHIEGGDVTGTIDESVRHAITKLAHIHFASNEAARKRIIQMGEHPDYVFMAGAPELEFVAHHDFVMTSDHLNQLGVGDVVDLSKPYLIVMQHPVTTEIGSNREHVMETLVAVSELGVPAIWFWPNVDAGTDEVSKAIRVFREDRRGEQIRFIKYMPPDHFMSLLKGARCLVGNSSAGIKECSFLGIPAVNIGTRQKNRLRGPNVVDVPYEIGAIKNAIMEQLSRGRYEPSHLYYQENGSRLIAQTLASVPLYVQKEFYGG